MRSAFVVATFLAAAVVVVASGAARRPKQSLAANEQAVVKDVYDGDTLTLRDGRRVRLLQIDTPELGSGECYSRAARSVLVSLTPPGSRIVIHRDPKLDNVDRYGRLLRYITRGKLRVNLELVRRGAATPYFYRGERGRQAAALLAAARRARGAKRGLWGACPSTPLDPDRPATTGRSGPPASSSRSGSPPTPAPATTTPGRDCDPSYPTVCIPPPPPDLDCKDVQARRFTVRWDVPNPDPHHFDGDHDGIGCE